MDGSLFNVDPEAGAFREKYDHGTQPSDAEITAARERATAARYAVLERKRTAEEVKTLISAALAARARELHNMGGHDVEADKTADLGRMVRMLRDPVPLAAALGLT